MSFRDRKVKKILIFTFVFFLFFDFQREEMGVDFLIFVCFKPSLVLKHSINFLEYKILY